jgi:signal transduction histidine kinase
MMLSNALKFTPPGGQVTITARRAGPADDVLPRHSSAIAR